MSTVLIVTGQEDQTAPMVEAQLTRSGVPFIRLNTETFGTEHQFEFEKVGDSLQCRLMFHGQLIPAQEITSIWYRRPVPPVPAASLVDPVAREFASMELTSVLYGILFALDCRWVNHPSAIRTASHKLLQLSVASALSFAIPDTCVSMAPERIRSFYQMLKQSGRHMIGKLVSKGPPHAPTPDEQYTIYTTLLDDDALSLDGPLSLSPAIYQECIEKAVELRVTVVGDQVFACAIHSQKSASTRIDWRHYDFPNTPHVVYQLDEKTTARCLALVRHFGLLFAAIDLIVRPDGQIVFLEINPNGQWGWIEELTGLPIAQTLAALLARTL